MRGVSRAKWGVMPPETLAKVTTSLGGDTLLLRSMTGREELGRMFNYELELLSEDDKITLSDLLGQPMTVDLQLADGSSRYFNGVVCRFAQTGHLGRYNAYRATLRPWLWLLTRTADCRIFQDLSVPDVIKHVFRDYGLTDFDEALSGSYGVWDYCVQYRETAFNFVSRLMEQEGIYYFFRHENGKHTLVLTDSYSAHSTTPGYEEIPYAPPQPGDRRDRDCIDDWRLSGQIQTGIYALDDFDFERPKASLRAKVTASGPAKNDYEVYDYPGEYLQASEGETYARVRIEELQTQFEQFEGRGNVRGLGAGALFKLSGYPRDDQNREYMVTATAYQIELGEYESSGHARREHVFRWSFTAIQGKVPFRLARITPKPLIAGPQTAIVVGKAGEEIWTDQHGRVKLQFHWDREGKSNESSSCWVRVAQYWAGSRFGSIHVPRMGQEVIVEFLEGDPDRPIVTGRVYNGNNMPPYELPANQTQTGWKSRSSKGGNPDNFNEIRFEDKKGSEQVFVQAEKDLEIYVKHDESRKVDNDRKKDVGKNETVTIGVDRTETVGKNETITILGDRVEKVAKSETITIGTTRSEMVVAAETVSVGAARAHTIGGADSLTVGGIHSVSVGGVESIDVGGSRSVSVGGNQSASVGGNQSLSVGKNESVSIAGKRSVEIAKDDSVTVSGSRTETVAKNDTLDVGKKLSITAADEIQIKTGDASITMKKNGEIVISGKNITIKGSGKINVKADGDVILKGSKVSQN